MAGEDVNAEHGLGGGDVRVEGGEEDKQGGCEMHDVEIGIDLRVKGMGVGDVGSLSGGRSWK